MSRLALRIRDLELLVALDETGSLRAASRRLHLTPSALSQAETERLLGRHGVGRSRASAPPRGARSIVELEASHSPKHNS